MKVVLASDGSPSSIHAAKVLCHLGIDRDALQLYVLTVSVDPFNTSPENLQPWRPEWEEQQKAFVARHHGNMKEILKDCCADPGMFHRQGDAAAEILALAERIDADLIVTGAVGHSMIERVLLGSVSDHVATHATCSVLVVRPAPASQSERELVQRLTLAYDGSTAAVEALSECALIEWEADTDITVLGVAQQFDHLMSAEYSAAAVENEHEILEAVTGHCETATHRIADYCPSVHASVIKGRHVGDAIVRTVEKDESDLVVLGDAGHSLLHQWILGNTTKYVLRHAPCSVWVSRYHLGRDVHTQPNHAIAANG